MLSFLAHLHEITAMVEEHIKLIMLNWNKDISDQLVSECCQFKEYLGFIISQENWKNPEINLMAISLNLTILKFYTTIPIASCEAKKCFLKLWIAKNKRGGGGLIWSTMSEKLQS